MGLLPCAYAINLVLIHYCIFIRFYTLWATFTDLFGHCLCVTMCDFIMYHIEIGICRELKQIATNVRAHCVAEPEQINPGNFLEGPTQTV